MLTMIVNISLENIHNSLKINTKPSIEKRFKASNDPLIYFLAPTGAQEEGILDLRPSVRVLYAFQLCTSFQTL